MPSSSQSDALGRPKRIFVSYSRDDSWIVDGCVRLLITSGASIFYDLLDIPPGHALAGDRGGRFS